MRVVLTGQKRFGRDVLDLLLERRDDIAGVSCPQTKGDRGYDKLYIAAQNHGLPLILNGRLTRETMPEGVDLIIAAHSHDFIGSATRLRARYGALGYHPSLLPRHRGRSAIEWVVRFGERVSGGTVYWLNDVVDGGPIAAQEACHVRAEDTALDLWVRELAPIGLRLFRRVLREVDAGALVALDQDKALATWEPAVDKVPRLYRPDLPMLGGPGGMPIIKSRDDANNYREGVA